MARNSDDRGTRFTRGVTLLTSWLGSPYAVGVALLLILSWMIGALVVPGGFGNQLYQLVINSVTTIITFVMVFVIQSSQNREQVAVQTKLDAQSEALLALVRQFDVDDDASELVRLMGVEEEPERKIASEHAKMLRRAQRERREGEG